MNTSLLAAVLTLIAVTQIGCSNEKKTPKQVQAAVTACMFDPTGACQQNAKTIAENPLMARKILAGSKTALANGGGGAVQVIQDPTTGTKTVIPIVGASVTNSDLQAKSMSIQSSIAAIEANPNSSYYNPEQPSQVVADRTPSSVSAQTVQSAAISAQSITETGSASGSYGEVTR